MTYENLSNDTFKILHRFNIRPADDTSYSNLKEDPMTVPNIVKCLQDKDLTFIPSPSDNDDDDVPNLAPRSKRSPLIDP